MSEASDIAASGTTADYFLGDRLLIHQPRRGYRAGIDAVLLAAAVAGSPSHVLDAGAGVGTAGLCVARRLADTRVLLLEKQSGLADLARRNAAENALQERVTVAEGEIGGSLPALQSECFDAIIANPPYFDPARVTLAATPAKATAHAMPECELAVWLKFMARMAKPGGSAVLVHKPGRIGEILDGFRNRFGAIKVLPVFPRAGEPAIRILVQATKQSRAPLEILPGLVLHGQGNRFTPEADNILRHGAALSW